MTTDKQSDCATVWFAILERAINLGDTEREAEAWQKLKELGVDVKFRPPHTNKDKSEEKSKMAQIKGALVVDALASLMSISRAAARRYIAQGAVHIDDWCITNKDALLPEGPVTIRCGKNHFNVPNSVILAVEESLEERVAALERQAKTPKRDGFDSTTAVYRRGPHGKILADG